MILAALIIANNILKPDYPEIYNIKPIKGDANAPVSIIEYSDYQCPACKQAYFDVERLLEEYEGKINLEYKHFPLRSMHPYAQKASEAAECANDFGKFWEYSQTLFKNNVKLSTSNLKSYAKELGINRTFNDCLDSGSKKLIVDAEYNEALSKSLRGTPSFFVNGKQMEYVQGLSIYDNLKGIIDKELEESLT